MDSERVKFFIIIFKDWF